MELTLPTLPNLNEYINLERSNKFAASIKKKYWTEYIAVACKAQHIPKLKKISKITFIWKHKDKRQDMDNVEWAQKFIWDGMVFAGIIPNDSWQYRPTRTLNKHEINKQDPGVVVIFK